MRPQDRAPYMVASALTFGGVMVGYHVPVIGVVLTVCLLLVVVAALLGDAGGAMADLVARPFAALGRWLAQKDDWRLARMAPVFGLVAGWLFRWVVNALQAQGGT